MKKLLILMLFICTISQGKVARVVYMTSKKTESVFIPVGKTTVISFPGRPAKVIVGNQGLFGVEYVEQDLAISALKIAAHSNLFVYLDGRRFGFNLRTTSSDAGDEIVLVKDAEEKRIKVKVRND